MNNEISQQGFKLVKGFFDKDKVKMIREEAKMIFYKQMERAGVVTDVSILGQEEDFNKLLYNFFEQDAEAVKNCGKQIQHLISLHKLSVSDHVVDQLKQIGLEFPNISTRPVLFFNSPALAKENVYHTVFPHQDWRSMQGSLDAIVLWVPLIDIDKNLGALEIIPGSHKWGLVSDELDHGFGKVNLTDEQYKLFESVEVEMGDALFFSSLLIHQSGNNLSGQIRWSAHFRYNNLAEPTFIARKFAHAYIYKPIENLITLDFPRKADIYKTFELNGKK